MLGASEVKISPIKANARPSSANSTGASNACQEWIIPKTSITPRKATP